MPDDAFRLDVGSARAAPGVRHDYSLAGRLPEVVLPSARLSPDEDVRVDLVVEAHGNEVVVDGKADATWTGACRRCLEPTAGQIEVTFREVYSEDPVEGEVFPLDGDQLDLRPMLSETLTLALPLAPLCRPDCPGPDPDAYPVGSSEASDQDEGPPEDDRWAALDDLRLDG